MLNLQQQWLRLWQRTLRLGRQRSEQDGDRRGNQLAAMLQQTATTIERARTLYKPEELMLCFNGGKDCTVLLDVLAQKRQPGTERTPSIRAVCVKSHDPFPEVEAFIDRSAERYQIELRRYDGALKLAIEQALVEQPQLRGVFLGCRRSDPGCGQLSALTVCDNGWPPLMRIFPLLEWSYHDIWHYLLSRQLPYCSLYDQGYTSLGDRSSTGMNPSLLVYDKQLGRLVYRPAYELCNGKLERANREDAQFTKAEQLNP